MVFRRSMQGKKLARFRFDRPHEPLNAGNFLLTRNCFRGGAAIFL
jgi:hypothetical protein